MNERHGFSDLQFFFGCLGVGVPLAAFKLVYGFFPIFLYLDAVVFLIAAGLDAVDFLQVGRWSYIVKV